MKYFTALLLSAIILVLACSDAYADTKYKDESLLRTSAGTYDLQRNTVSNFDFYSTNYGISEFDVTKNQGGGYWPRGSLNQYLFASGIWFAARKLTPDNSTIRKYVEITYNPNSGKSWFVPGRIEDGDTVVHEQFRKYRVYFSTDFDHVTGEPRSSIDGPNWPLWITDASPNSKDCFGAFKYEYVQDENKRNRSNYPLGPSFISDEDIFSVYKDTDLSRYEGGASKRRNEGYPLRLQFESLTFSWKDEIRKDIIVKLFKIINKSYDTLWNCWLGSVNDVDLARAPNLSYGAGNDRMSYFFEEPALNLSYTWSETARGEKGYGFGYAGISTIETPVVDNKGFIKSGNSLSDPSEQIGMITCRNWRIENDLADDDPRFDYLASGLIDSDNGAGDKRLAIASGPFNFIPGQTVRFAVSNIMALPAKGGEADGTYEDLTGFKQSVNKKDVPQVNATDMSLIGKANRIKADYYGLPYNSVYDDKNSSDGSLSIYPNPAGNILNIEISDQYLQDRIRIYSLQGVILLESPFSVRIDISSLPVGLYYIRVNDKVKAFVKM